MSDKAYIEAMFAPPEEAPEEAVEGTIEEYERWQVKTEYVELLENINKYVGMSANELENIKEAITIKIDNIRGMDITIPEEELKAAENYYSRALEIEASVHSIYKAIGTDVAFKEINFTLYDADTVKKDGYSFCTVTLNAEDTEQIKFRIAYAMGNQNDRDNIHFINHEGSNSPFAITKDGEFSALTSEYGEISVPLNQLETYDVGTIVYVENRRELAREQAEQEAARKNVDRTRLHNHF